MKIISPRIIKLNIEYDGTAYHGWQRQINSVSIQQTIEESLERIIKEHRPVVAASRTDTGVHALNQVAHFWTTTVIPDWKLQRALNNELPKDIVVKELISTPNGFHAMKGACSKIYGYLIENGKFPTAHRRNISWWIPVKLDVDAMKKGAKYFIGEKDFKSLMTGRSYPKSTIRTIYNVEVESQMDLVRIVVHGNAFLKQMVRAIVGTLVQVGKGKLLPDEVGSILKSHNRSNAGRNAPAKGLCLIKVIYEPIGENYKSRQISDLWNPANSLTFYH